MFHEFTVEINFNDITFIFQSSCSTWAFLSSTARASGSSRWSGCRLTGRNSLWAESSFLRAASMLPSAASIWPCACWTWKGEKIRKNWFQQRILCLYSGELGNGLYLPAIGAQPPGMWHLTTVHSQYIVVIFLGTSHERHPITPPWGRVMGCHSWMRSLAKVLQLWLLLSVYHHVTDDHDISKGYSISFIHGDIYSWLCGKGMFFVCLNQGVF